MKIFYEENKVIIEDLKSFEPKHIFECGQCFRWFKQKDDSYTGVVKGKILNVKRDGEKIILKNTNKHDFENIWWDYFDLDRDYEDLKRTLAQKDENLKKAVEFGYGIRILNQDPFETLISFIISANNNINRIKSSIKKISKLMGDYIGEYESEEYYSFPSVKKFSYDNEEDLKSTGIGFRADHILKTCKKIQEENINMDDFLKFDSKEVVLKLKEFAGVGPKVSQCISLFSLKNSDAFPVDVWVKRVMEEFYVEEGLSLPKIELAGNKIFGQNAGLAQQYLFYYARELGIGKK